MNVAIWIESLNEWIHMCTSIYVKMFAAEEPNETQTYVSIAWASGAIRSRSFLRWCDFLFRVADANVGLSVLYCFCCLVILVFQYGRITHNISASSPRSLNVVSLFLCVQNVAPPSFLMQIYSRYWCRWCTTSTESISMNFYRNGGYDESAVCHSKQVKMYWFLRICVNWIFLLELHFFFFFEQKWYCEQKTMWKVTMYNSIHMAMAVTMVFHAITPQLGYIIFISKLWKNPRIMNSINPPKI